MEDIMLDEILAKMDEEIKNRGFTKKEVAKRLGISPSTLSSAFTLGRMRLEMAIRIANEIGVSLKEMFPEEIYEEWMKMPLLDLIRNVCRVEAEKILLESKIENSITLDSKITPKKK